MHTVYYIILTNHFSAIIHQYRRSSQNFKSRREPGLHTTPMKCSEMPRFLVIPCARLFPAGRKVVWWFRNAAIHLLILVAYPIFYKVFLHPRWLLGISSSNSRLAEWRSRELFMSTLHRYQMYMSISNLQHQHGWYCLGRKYFRKLETKVKWWCFSMKTPATKTTTLEWLKLMQLKILTREKHLWKPSPLNVPLGNPAFLPLTCLSDTSPCLP